MGTSRMLQTHTQLSRLRIARTQLDRLPGLTAEELARAEAGDMRTEPAGAVVRLQSQPELHKTAQMSAAASSPHWRHSSAAQCKHLLE